MAVILFQLKYAKGALSLQQQHNSENNSTIKPMATDDLATKGRASAAMIWAYISQNILVSVVAG